MPTRGLSVEVDILVEKDGDRYHAFCPSFTGLHMPGDTEEEAVKNAREAVVAFILSYLKHGDPVPGLKLVQVEKTNSYAKGLLTSRANRIRSFTENVDIPVLVSK
jgi:predicted RNase H-like HicB family nuclease